VATIRRVHQDSGGRYGSPRVHAVVRSQGRNIGRGRIERLMRRHGIRAIMAPPRRARTTDSRHALPIAPNLLARDFTAAAPNRIWLADITYVPTGEGWLYLAAVMDLFSRKIVGWAMRDYLRTELASSALTMALQRQRPAVGLIHHSDRGVQGDSSGGRNTLIKEVAMKIRRRHPNRAGRAPLLSPGRPSVAGRDERRRFWAAIAAGLVSEDAALEAGVSAPVGIRWFRAAGGITPAMFGRSAKPVSGRYLSFTEREEIALLRAQGFSMQEVARRLGRAASTISRELRRNAATRSGGLEYRATTAQWHAERSARRPKPGKPCAWVIETTSSC
jgi:transposase